ncbi:MAG: nucleotide exchange factor GrpE [Clostridia bacterium]|nr:nucleotide exchange factor GrpE [Clostridia bacterium]
MKKEKAEEMKPIEDQENANSPEESKNDQNNASDKELAQLQEQLDAKSKQCDEYLNMLQRTMAEFDNYKKRTAREKVDLYSEAVSEVVGSILPVLDNLERALQASGNEEAAGSLKEGIIMVHRQFKDVMKSIGVDEIKGVGESFDPNLHNAVMHVEDEAYGENVIVEEFQKGYIYKEKVIRHSMVKVAN